MADPIIALVDNRSVAVGPTLDEVAQAVQAQITEDFAPVWGLNATVIVRDQEQPDDWVLYVVDQSSVGYGFHSVYWDDQGKAHFYGEVTGSYDNWGITASHEALEMLGDPYTNTCNNGYLQEVGDPVEDFSYSKLGIDVSDFVFPSWFGDPQGPQDQWDQMGKCTGPFQVVGPSGYIWSCATDQRGERMIGLRLSKDFEQLPHLFAGAPNQFGSMLFPERAYRLERLREGGPRFEHGHAKEPGRPRTV